MSTDFSPLSAFAPEFCAPPAVAPGDGQTLTLPLRTGRAAGTEPMTGRLSLRATQAPVLGLHHVAITAAGDAAALTITL